jgi:hypothetical protein
MSSPFQASNEIPLFPHFFSNVCMNSDDTERACGKIEGGKIVVRLPPIGLAATSVAQTSVWGLPSVFFILRGSQDRTKPHRLNRLRKKAALFRWWFGAPIFLRLAASERHIPVNAPSHFFVQR